MPAIPLTMYSEFRNFTDANLFVRPSLRVRNGTTRPWSIGQSAWSPVTDPPGEIRAYETANGFFRAAIQVIFIPRCATTATAFDDVNGTTVGFVTERDV